MKTAIVFLSVLFATSAFAKMPYMQAFKKAYPEASSIAKCTLCHVTPGYTVRTAYGHDLEVNAINFQAVEALDSDADGFTNLDEIKKLTDPSNVESHP